MVLCTGPRSTLAVSPASGVMSPSVRSSKLEHRSGGNRGKLVGPEVEALRKATPRLAATFHLLHKAGGHGRCTATQFRDSGPSCSATATNKAFNRVSPLRFEGWLMVKRPTPGDGHSCRSSQFDSCISEPRCASNQIPLPTSVFAPRGSDWRGALWL